MSCCCEQSVCLKSSCMLSVVFAPTSVSLSVSLREDRHCEVRRVLCCIKTTNCNIIDLIHVAANEADVVAALLLCRSDFRSTREAIASPIAVLAATECNAASSWQRPCCCVQPCTPRTLKVMQLWTLLVQMLQQMPKQRPTALSLLSISATLHAKTSCLAARNAFCTMCGTRAGPRQPALPQITPLLPQKA